MACASLLFAEGRNVKQVQEWLGHPDPGFTLRTYVHLIDEGVGDAEFMDSAVSPDPSGYAKPSQWHRAIPRQPSEATIRLLVPRHWFLVVSNDLKRSREDSLEALRQLRPSPSMVVALVALFVALGGGAVAVTTSKKLKLPKNSVGKKQIKKGAVGKSELANNAVVESKIANNAVSGAAIQKDFLSWPKASTSDGGPSANASQLVGTKFSGTGPLDLSVQTPIATVRDSDGTTCDQGSFGFFVCPLAFDDEVQDTDDVHSGTVSWGTGVARASDFVTAPADGLYNVTFSVTWDDFGADRYLGISLFKDPGGRQCSADLPLCDDAKRITGVEQRVADDSRPFPQFVSTQLNLKAGDTIQPFAAGDFDPGDPTASLIADDEFEPPTLTMSLDSTVTVP